MGKFTDAHRNFREQKFDKIKITILIKNTTEKIDLARFAHTGFLVSLKLSISFSNQTKSLADFDGICAKSHEPGLRKK